jgi:hypothetical protein
MRDLMHRCVGGGGLGLYRRLSAVVGLKPGVLPTSVMCGKAQCAECVLRQGSLGLLFTPA